MYKDYVKLVWVAQEITLESASIKILEGLVKVICYTKVCVMIFLKRLIKGIKLWNSESRPLIWH